LPKKTLAKVNNPGNPARTDEMLDAPVFKFGRGPQATPPKELVLSRKRIKEWKNVDA
jgi:hypothetical protein